MPTVLEPPPKIAPVDRRERPALTPLPFPAASQRTTPGHLPTAAALLDRLFGPVPLERVIWEPFPGTATFEDCLQAHEVGHRCELVDGVLLEKADFRFDRDGGSEENAGFIESEIAMRLGERVGRWDPSGRRGRRTGEAGFVELSTGRVRGPDYSFFLHRRFPGGRLPPNSVGSVKVPALAPDFAVEILSESNTREEIDGKLDDLFAAGCRLAWVIDPRARTARVVTPAEDQDAERPWVETTADDSATLTGDPVLPGFAVSLAELLAAPDAEGEPEPTPDVEDTGG